ncbi:Hpt domain-containing protein [bacterium]|nr:Hpt domain-containing protein [bacterium]
MQISDPEFFKQILEMFRMEAQEHLETISSGVSKLKQGVTGLERKEVVETIFRAAHSLKGAARTVGITDLEEIGQEFEKIFSMLKQKESMLTDDTFEIFDIAENQLGLLIKSVDKEGKVLGDKSELVRLISQIHERILLQNA